MILKKNLTKFLVINTKKHYYFLLIKNNKKVLWSQTTCSNRYVNFNKNVNNVYLIGLKLKFYLIKSNLDFPLLFLNTISLNGYLKLLKKGIFF